MTGPTTALASIQTARYSDLVESSIKDPAKIIKRKPSYIAVIGGTKVTFIQVAQRRTVESAFSWQWDVIIGGKLWMDGFETRIDAARAVARAKLLNRI